MRRRRSSSKRRKGGSFLFKIVFLTFALAGLTWVMVTMYQLWQKVETLPEVKGHDFIASTTQTPVLLIAQQSAQPAQLDSLIILKADFEQRTIAAMQLPTNLSDGNTSIAQYLESHYYKEMQLAIEGQLALPLTGYIIQPRVLQIEGKDSLVNNFNFKSAPTWWSTTIGLPLWLKSTSPVATNLSESDLMQLAWLIRDLKLSSNNLVQVPSTAQNIEGGQLQLKPEAIDPIVQDIFVSDKVRSEGASIVVKNATQVGGLAALASRFVANMGGEIVAVEPADTSQTSSSITAETESSLSKSINQFLGIPTTIQPQTGRERAEVELIIGTDALARLGK